MKRRLRVEFEDLEVFRREYHRNLANGGAFVATEEDFELRETLTVELVLAFCDLSVVLEAEVVSVGCADLARGGGRRGVAVQFHEPAEQLRRHLSDEIGRVIPQALPQVWPRDAGVVRRDERSDARVRAIVGSPLGMQDCVTRDLSDSGALIAINGPPVPVGETVHVTLAHPHTREELTLNARVVRHEKSSGRVGSIAVHFDIPPERQEWTVGFLGDLRDTAKAKRRSAIRGPIAVLGLGNLVQMFSSATDFGTLVIRRGSEEGRLVFEGGALRHARFGGATGVKALSRMLTTDAGSFEFYGDVDPDEPKGQPEPMYGVVLEAMQFVDELRRLDTSRFPPSASVRLGDGPPAADPDKLESQILDLTRAGTSVRGLLDDLPDFDALIYRAMASLLESDQIRVELSRSGD